MRGGSNATSPNPGMAGRSRIFSRCPPSFRYCSSDNKTCAARPRSVMNTGPFLAALLARPAFWLNSRLDKLVIATARACF